MKNRILFIIALIWFCTRLYGQNLTHMDQVFSRSLDTVTGCFVLYDLEDLDFDPEYIDMVKDIMLQDEAGDYTLYGKTGGGRIGENKFIGWYVGFVETSDNVFIFSMNIDAKDFITARDLREKITREILKAAKAI